MAILDDGTYINDSDIGLNLDPPSPSAQYPSFFGDSASFAHTPSYNGSYSNSPYSVASELSFQDEDNASAFGGLFSGSDIHIATNQDAGYDPTEYDNPDAASLLMFADDYSTGLAPYDPSSTSGISLTAHQPRQQQPQQAMYGDYSSPSSNGGGDSGNEQNRSRASSVSSQQRQQQQRFSTSPRLEVAQSFEHLNFQSPHWVPSHLPHDQHEIPHYNQQQHPSSIHRARSLSPNSRQSAQSPPRLFMPEQDQLFAPPPMINAPEGDGDNGPALNLVPATPVNGGVRNDGQTQGYDREMYRPPAASSQPHQHQQNKPFVFPPNRTSTLDPPVDTGIHINNGQGNYLFPHPPRSRSKSETQLSSPVSLWGNTPFGRDGSHDSALADDPHPGIVNMNDVSPDLHHTSVSPTPSFLTPQNHFLTVDFNGMGGGASSLRRARSESGRGMGHTRGARSEDVRPQADLLAVPGMWSGPQFLTPGYGPTLPPMPSSSTFEPQQQPSYGRAQGHIRRASSGSRSERGTAASWGVDPTSVAHYQMGMSGDGGGGRQRHSPYPSPHHSPMVQYDDLPQSDPLDGLGGPAVVTKQNVTTSRTARASHGRRKQDATFHCPIPGCGSTFTRSFNLKGHIRSHNEEKPFVCKWPGCEKGFARQHDCKRHEQLHTNYRPFVCDGCQKPFARMDALNRHLRSEGGADCQRVLEKNGTLPDLSTPSSSKRKTRNGPTASLPVPLTSTASGGVDVSMPDAGETVDWGMDMGSGVMGGVAL